MTLTNFSAGVASFGAPVGAGIPAVFSGNTSVTGGPLPRRYLFVDGVNGLDGNDGLSTDAAKRTIQAAIDARLPGDCIIVAPLEDPGAGYNESLVIERYTTDGTSGGPLYIVGLGPRGSVAVAPSTANSEGLDNREDDVTLINLGIAAPDGGDFAVRNYGSRFRAYGCKFEGAATAGGAFITGPGTIAQVDVAFTHGDSGDIILDDCELCWTFDAVRFVGTDYGAPTQLLFKNCRYHNFSNAGFIEAIGSGGGANVLFRNLEIVGGFMDDQEGGTAPTFYFSLNSDNANDGIVTQLALPVALASGGKTVVSTALHWVCNYHTGGVSNGQPS